MVVGSRIEVFETEDLAYKGGDHLGEVVPPVVGAGTRVV